MKYILQIFTGPWREAYHPAEDIIRTIGGISAQIPVDRVIIGWNTDAALYRKVGAFLRESGIQMLLWLPVFSEISGIAEPDDAPDLWGRPAVPPLHQEGEDFRFGCPSSPRNLQIVKDIYEKYFADCGFGGVFLDKIRYQSFVAGVPGVLGCGCERCRKAFADRGVDTASVRKRYEEKQDAFFDMASFPMNGEFRLRDPLAQSFFEAKEEIIAGAVAELSRHFRSMGLAVGLDLFAPLVSRFVGQRYSLLASHADFIKPMLYRKTTAPAGIGYEYALLKQHAPGACGVPEIAMDRAFLDTQLEAVGAASNVKYPGVEINYREDIARTDAAYVTESLRAVRDAGLEGAALCWNMMLAPEAHIRAVSALG